MFVNNNSQYVANDKLGYKPAANFSGYSDLAAYAEIYYDHLGARVNSSTDKTPDKVDMITIGCSQAWGQGVTNKETFTQKVAELTGMKVANFGVTSYGGVESLIRLKENLNLKPKYVVYAFWEDHLNRNLILCNQTFPVCLERPVLKYQSNKEFKIRYPHYTNITFNINKRWFMELADYYDREIRDQAKNDPRCVEIQNIDGIGPITASAIVATIGDPKIFKNGREVAAWLGLVPQQHSSGNNIVLGSITKRRDRYIRKLLIHGARSAIKTCENKTDKKSQWIVEKKLRIGFNKTAVALANKNARTIWAMLATGEAYRKVY